MFIELKLNMETVLNSYFHFHLCDLLGLFNIAVIMQDCKINLLDHSQLHITGDCNTHKISYSACNSIEGFVLFLEIGELEFEALGFG